MSDRFASSFWWSDQLGLLAQRGQPVSIRQTLSGADYGLIDDWTLTPRPDYFASVLWKRVMGAEVLASGSDDEQVRVYAHCGVDGGVGLAVVNLHDEGTSRIDVQGAEGPWQIWSMTADALDSAEVSINGEVAAVDDAGSLQPFADATDRWLVVPPRSVTLALGASSGEVCPVLVR